MMMRKAGLSVLFAVSVGLPRGVTVQGAPSPALSLAGTWQVQLEKGREQELADPSGSWQPVRLPGSLTANGIGEEVSLETPWMGFTGRGGWASDPRYAPYRQPGNIKVPFWLQPLKYYQGKAWYRRDVEIPAGWGSKRLVLMLERCHWGSTVWVDGKRFESVAGESLSAPHRYELGVLASGQHTLIVRIDNNYLVRVGPDAHSVTDHTQGNWNGIVGRIELQAHDPLRIESQQVYPKNNGTVRIALRLRNDNLDPVAGKLTATIREKATGKVVGRAEKAFALPRGTQSDGSHILSQVVDEELTVTLAAAPKLWSEFTPEHLYAATATVTTDKPGNGSDTATTTFGFREIGTDGRTFLVNGVPTLMRGNLDCAAFPLTGYPSSDIREWRRIFKVYKAYGLNQIRFHSWCPPEAAFAAADEEGMYLQPECATWRGTCPYKNAKPVEPYLMTEAERICREYGNHPSFVLFAHGNEPWDLDNKWLNNTWVPEMKKLDPRHLVTAGSHYPLGDNNDFHVPGCTDGFYMRYHGSLDKLPATARNYEDQIALRKAPCIAHETGQWCVFPNLREIAKYTGVMKAKNYEIVRDFLKAGGLLDQADDFLMASGKFQTLLYKEEIEAYLRTRGIGGYQLLGLNDFPGQGTALVGVVDVFWDSKPYVTPAEYKRFSGPVVPLAIMEKRVWTSDETFKAQIRIAQYSATPIIKARPCWTLLYQDGRKVASGKLSVIDIPVGNTTELGMVQAPLNSIATAARLTLKVWIPGTDTSNDWHLWVYPANVPTQTGKTRICTTTAEALAALQAGGTVLLAPNPKQIPGNTHGAFQTIFWNKAWFPGQKEHCLGLLIKNRHPALAAFPTDFHADWQWWDLMQNSKPMILDDLPRGISPIVQPVDDWNTCRKLGLLFEAKVGNGRLMVVSINLQEDLEKRPVARQFLHSLLAYLESPAFRPTITLTEEQVRRLAAEKKG